MKPIVIIAIVAVAMIGMQTVYAQTASPTYITFHPIPLSNELTQFIPDEYTQSDIDYTSSEKGNRLQLTLVENNQEFTVQMFQFVFQSDGSAYGEQMVPYLEDNFAKIEVYWKTSNNGECIKISETTSNVAVICNVDNEFFINMVTRNGGDVESLSKSILQKMNISSYENISPSPSEPTDTSQKNTPMIQHDAFPTYNEIDEGETIIFSGVFADFEYVYEGYTINLKEGIGGSTGNILATAITDGNGEFVFEWTTAPKFGGGEYWIYMEFDGDEDVEKTWGANYRVTVIPNDGVAAPFSQIVLDTFPKIITAGDSVTLSGQLTHRDSDHSIPFSKVYIQDDEDFLIDTAIGSAITDSNGYFEYTWTPKVRVGAGAYDVYVEYTGTSEIDGVQSVRKSLTVNKNENFSYSTSITLDPIQSLIISGEKITFTGRLMAGTQPLSNHIVEIVDDEGGGVYGDSLAKGYTDSQGYFSISWIASQGILKEKTIEVFAFFSGRGSVNYASSSDVQELYVKKYASSITLDYFPSQVNIGDEIVFTGKVTVEQGDIENYVIYIKDEDLGNPDDLMATGILNQDGTFVASWRVVNTDDDEITDVYAVFEGGERYKRSTTCDYGNTSDYGGMCTDTIKLKILPQKLPTSPQPPSIPPTVPIPPPSNMKSDYVKFNDGYRWTGQEKFLMWHAFDFQTIHVVISPSPDSYDETVRYAGAVQEGILEWTDLLDKNYGGNWNVTFEVLTKENPRAKQTPDVITNIVTYEQEEGCLDDFYGYANVYTTHLPRQNYVCGTIGTQPQSYTQVSATTGHEFVHSIGLSHAWDKSGDRMCSKEGDTWTCNQYAQKSSSPSDFDIGALVKLYGSDGWGKNNNLEIPLRSDYVFTASEFFGVENSNYNTQKSDSYSSQSKLEAEQQEAMITQLEAEKEAQQNAEQETKIAQLEAEKETQQSKITQLEAEQNGGGCLIATATYDSEMATEVQQLRELRDNQLLQTESGTAFMGTFNDVYYSFSPTIADMEREHPMFKEVVKLAITPMISSLSIMENANSESEVLGLGLSVIALNLGMYLGVPAIVIVGIRRTIF